MKRFLAVFTGSASAFEKANWAGMEEGHRRELEKKGMAAWGEWAENHKANILDWGSPLGKTKKADADGISNINNALTAYTLIQAESHEAAAEMFRDHPHFTIFPGETVEIMECLPMPTR